MSRRIFSLLLVGSVLLSLLPILRMAAEGPVLFQEDFSGTLAQWEVVTGTWAIENGELNGIGAGGGIDAWIYAGDPTWTDYRLSAKVYFDSGEAEFILRSTGHFSNEYRILLWSQNSPSYTNCYGLVRYKNGVNTSFTPGNYPSPVTITNPADVRVDAIGNVITIYVNGSIVASVTDPDPLAAGRIGLAVIWDWHARFDNVVVTSLSETPALTIDAGPDATIGEGSAFNSSGSVIGSLPGEWSATVDYGDGSVVQSLALNPDGTFTLNHIYLDNGVYNATVSCTYSSNEGCGLNWSSRESTQMPPFYGGVATVDGMIYAFGGGNDAIYTSALERYDPSTGHWVPLADLPAEPRIQMGVAACAGKLYVMGGYGYNGFDRTAYAYDPTTNGWTRCANMLGDRRLFGAASVGGKIYAIGGWSGENVPIVEQYDPATNEWTICAPMLHPREYLAVTAATDGKLYAIGGLANGELLGITDAYDPATGQWTECQGMPTPRRHLAVVGAADGKVYAIGGGSEWVALKTVEVYDPAVNEWAACNDLLEPRVALAAAQGGDGYIYAIGGNKVGEMGTVEATSTTGVCGSTVDDTAVVTVLNVAPNLGPITASAEPVQVNTLISASAVFTDPGVLDTHAAAWNWGDGSVSAGVINEVNGSGSVDGEHVYIAPGIYTLGLTVTDKDGASSQATYEFVVVYDPEGGFVTGGGWINSPEGAFVADSALTGKAAFGFVSRYKKGVTVPSGETQFQFKVANLNFHSESYDWLVVAGTKAQFKGTGTINGAGSYSFLLTAIDGTPDRFRIKIWDRATDTVVYDNGMDSVVEGGNIVIHD